MKRFLLSFLFLNSIYICFSQQQETPPDQNGAFHRYGPCTAHASIPEDPKYICEDTMIFYPMTGVKCDYDRYYMRRPDGYWDGQAFNPRWFRFYCYKSGAFGFLLYNKLWSSIENKYVTGGSLNWSMHDITNATEEQIKGIYDNKFGLMAYNWFQDAKPYPTTGAMKGGTVMKTMHARNGGAMGAWSPLLSFVEGREYLLLVAPGYLPHVPLDSLDLYIHITGGTAIVASPKETTVKRSWLDCDRSKVFIVLSKVIRKSTVHKTDFAINNAVVTGATTVGGKGKFSDTLLLQLATSLSAGDYSITLKKGDDDNVLLDPCNRDIGPLTTNLKIPLDRIAKIDSIGTVKCQPTRLQFSLNELVKCSSIAPDGSDFYISGPEPVTITNAIPLCINGVTTSVTLTLSKMILTGGTYTLSLKVGTDGNSLISECNVSSIPSSISFNAPYSILPVIDSVVKRGCKFDTIFFSNKSQWSTSWLWSVDGIVRGANNNMPLLLPRGEKAIVNLKVSNSTCDASISMRVKSDSAVLPLFDVNEYVCTNEAAVFKDMSSGPVVQWNWYFGNGFTSKEKHPPPQFFTLGGTNFRSVLTVKDNIGCEKSLSKDVKTMRGCEIVMPSAFTPNGDGKNDKLYPINYQKAVKIKFVVYNRYGQTIFKSSGENVQWDGRFKGIPQPTGTYAWSLDYTDRLGGSYTKKGSVLLIR